MSLTEQAVKAKGVLGSLLGFSVNQARAFLPAFAGVTVGLATGTLLVEIANRAANMEGLRRLIISFVVKLILAALWLAAARQAGATGAGVFHTFAGFSTIGSFGADILRELIRRSGEEAGIEGVAENIASMIRGGTRRASKLQEELARARADSDSGLSREVSTGRYSAWLRSKGGR